MSFHSSDVFLGCVPNNKKVIITANKNFEMKLTLLLNIAVAQLVIGTLI